MSEASKEAVSAQVASIRHVMRKPGVVTTDRARAAFLSRVVEVTQALQLWAQCAADGDLSSPDLFDNVRRLLQDLKEAQLVLEESREAEGGTRADEG